MKDTYPKTPPNYERKWKKIEEKMAHRTDEIGRIITSRKQAFLQGSPLHVEADFRDMISVGYAMALEDNGLKDW